MNNDKKNNSKKNKFEQRCLLPIACFNFVYRTISGKT